jgi:heme/copper-type cytochrome/quinol oxidase subunit 1
MSTLDPTIDHNIEPAVDADIDGATGRAEGASASPSIVAVLTASDHKVIGRLLIGSSLLGALIVGVLGFVLGLERIDGDGTLIEASVLTQLFAGYRVGLVEAALLPLMLGICVAVVPLQVGARSLAFPRLAAAGFWAWFSGITLVIVALANNGGPSGGNADMVSLYLGANALALVGLTAIAVTVATSVLTTRAPGMRMKRVPLFTWGALVSSLGLALVLPVAVGVHIFLYVDYQYTQGAFGAARGILDWTFYLLTGPGLAIFVVPAVAFLAEVIPVVLRKRLVMRDVAITGIALVGVAALAGVTQQDVINVPWRGEGLSFEHIRPKIGDVITFALLVLLPLLGVLAVLGIGALAAKPPRRGAPASARPNFIVPLPLAAIGVLFVLLGIAASALNSIDDVGLQGTVFEEGATVALVYGGIAAGLGAVTYWIPKLTGRQLATKQVGGLVPLVLLGTALASIPYLIEGFLDQPASSGTYSNEGPGELINGLVMAGHGLMGLAVLAFIGLVVPAFLGVGPAAGGPAADNPWGAHTLEWTTPSPAPEHNFAVTPTVLSPEPVLDLTAAPDFARSDHTQKDPA